MAIAAAAASAEVIPPALTGMRVHLFQNKTGSWSEDVLAPGNEGRWNAVAGPESTNAALVVVEVSGPPDAVYNGYFGAKSRYAVRLVAQEKGQATRLLDRTQLIPNLSETGHASLSFLIYPTGCTPVRLIATTVGPKPAKPMEKTIAFACGE